MGVVSGVARNTFPFYKKIRNKVGKNTTSMDLCAFPALTKCLAKKYPYSYTKMLLIETCK